MSKEELAKIYATQQADALTEIYTDVSPEEWQFEYDLAYKEYMKQ